MQNTKPVYSVVIPVYNSEKMLDELYDRLVQVFDNVIKEQFEMILVDDASSDNSWYKMGELREGDKRIKIIRLAKNFGQHNALMCGFNHISGDFVITMDDDLQHPPEEIPKLITAIKRNPEIDAVMGRYNSKKHSWWRNLGTVIMRKIMAPILRLDKKYKGSSFRLIRANIIQEMVKIETYQPRVGQMLLLVSKSYDSVPVRHDPRADGKSGYSIFRLTKDFINNILNNSTVILRFTSIIGFSSAGLSMVLALYYLIRFFTVGVAVSGFTTIVVINLFFSGIMLFSLGVVGEYLMKILFETKGYPQFVIKQKEL